MAPQRAEGEDSLLKKKAREAHLELLLLSYLSPTTAVLLVIFFSTGVPTTTPSNFHHDVSTQLFCKPPERQYICQRGKKTYVQQL
jgi:hypothetical protein